MHARHSGSLIKRATDSHWNNVGKKQAKHKGQRGLPLEMSNLETFSLEKNPPTHHSPHTYPTVIWQNEKTGDWGHHRMHFVTKFLFFFPNWTHDHNNTGWNNILPSSLKRKEELSLLLAVSVSSRRTSLTSIFFRLDD